MAVKKARAQPASKPARNYVSQADIPIVPLDEAIRIPRALADHYGSRPTSPLRVAAAAGISPTSSMWKYIAGSAIAYGLTTGGYNANEIALTSLGRRIVKPLEEGDDGLAMREALLRPKIIGEFLRRYNGSKLPREDIAMNVLHDLGVPSERTERAFELIVKGAESVGFIHDIKGSRYVDLGTATGTRVDSAKAAPSGDDATDDAEVTSRLESHSPPDRSSSAAPVAPASLAAPRGTPRSRRVFVTHGKNRTFIEAIKKLLGFGEMEAIVSAERESVSIPVPDKVMTDMRSCGAAMIHVDDEQKLMDSSAKEHIVLNPNVLIEIGAAMALYGRRFILLVKEGTALPSNLQGLYEVRYKGDSLDGDATIRLMQAIADIKNHPLPVTVA
jgi:predicted nucleotide-binding protein